ncbi:MAG: hypothetical protein AB7F64_04805, partial [Gammaproteobacteria bacterium]
MHAQQLLQTFLKKSCPFISLKRLEALMAFPMTATQSSALSITGLGRAHISNTTQKHQIKRVNNYHDWPSDDA